MGTISFHIHGERAKNAAISSNVSVYISPSLYNNPAADDAITRMRVLFADEVAVVFANDWLMRTVSAGYLSSNVLRPPSSPIKASRSNNEHIPLVGSPQTRPGHSLSHSSSISTTSSLTDSMTTIEETMPTPTRRSRSGNQPPVAMPPVIPMPPATPTGNRMDPTGPTQLMSTLPSSLTMSSTVTVSAAVIAPTPTGVRW